MLIHLSGATGKVVEYRYSAVVIHYFVSRPLIRKENGRVFVYYPGPENFFNEKSQLYLAEKKGLNPVPCRNYLIIPRYIFLLLIPLFYLFYYLTQVKFLKRMLENYMRIFTLGYISDVGPTPETRRKLKFIFNIVGEAKGEEKTKIRVKVRVLFCYKAFTSCFI